MSYIAVPGIVNKCFEIKLSFIWYCFHVTITRRQRIVHVHVVLLQLIDHHQLSFPTLVEGGKCPPY